MTKFVSLLVEVKSEAEGEAAEATYGPSAQTFLRVKFFYSFNQEQKYRKENFGQSLGHSSHISYRTEKSNNFKRPLHVFTPS